MNFFLGFALLIILSRVSSVWWAAVIKAFIAINVFALLNGLVPRKVNFSGRNFSSDGLAILSMPFMSKSKIDEEIENCFLWEGCRNYNKGKIEAAIKSYKKGVKRFPNSTELANALANLENK